MNILKSIFKKSTRFYHWFQNASLKKKLFVATVVTVILFVVFSSISGGNQQQIQTDIVKRGTITETVSESGNIESNQVAVYSTADGVIQEVSVENGNTVNAGDNLFKVKATANDEEKAEAWASYQSAVSAQKNAEQTKLANDATMWTKQQALLNARSDKKYKDENTTNPTTKTGYTELEKQSIDAAVVQAEKDFLSTEQKYKDSDFSITSGKAQVSATWIKYQKTQDNTVKASIDGTIANLAYGVGDKVSAQSQSGSGGGASSPEASASSANPVLAIGTGTEYIIKIPFAEGDINKIKVGQEAQIAIAAIKDREFKGNVSRVDAYGTDVSGVITYNVYVKITNPDPTIKPSMNATVTIESAKHENVLVVPNSAIKPYKGGKAVQVVDQSEQYKYVAVKTGLKSATETEILEGVQMGQKIVTSATAIQPSGGGLFGR